MNTDSYLGFNVRLPIGLQVISPIVNSNTPLDDFALFLCTVLGTDQFQPYRTELEASLRDGPLKGTNRTKLNVAVRSLAIESAEEITSNFISKLKEKLVPNENATPSVAQSKKELDTFAEKNLAGFKQLSPAKNKETATKAATKVSEVVTKYQIPPALVTKAAQLAFYDFILLCDDSGSMQSDTRIKTLEASVRGLFKVARLLNSETRFAMYPFQNPVWENLKTEAEMEGAIKNMKYNTGEDAPKPLDSRVLKPLLAKARAKTLTPTVVVVITDGAIGDVSSFCKNIAKFNSEIKSYGYTGPAVLFLICRVGEDKHAAVSLQGLKTDQAIKQILFYSEDSLDAKLASMGSNTDAYVGMVIEDLVKAMDLQAYNA